MAFAKRKILVSALGTAEPYCYLQKPDYGHGDFKNERGVYKVSLTCPIDDPKAVQMMNLITETAEADYAERLAAHEENPPQVARGKKPLLPYQGDLPFFDNGDGTVTFNFKCYGSFTDKKTGENRPIELAVVDAKGVRIRQVPAISGGSKLKLKFSLIPYGWSQVAGASVKLQLEGVMLIDLVEFGGGGGDDWGDETIEGGYVASSDQRQAAPQGDSWNANEGEPNEPVEDDEDF
ncbi:ssDNA binding protein [Erwinia phage vB_EamP-L1]|uniref:Single-stranded DNA-binding protein n=1 Tax=Erwinia phage vB_EamP-L1 TaxID=1051673 RepID=G0YQ55_9CAUD|nr:Gp2.5-like ssDNA binding protein and ssDNA annealing protein [Erwinia phage vB_EamP-L1]AEJ81482.1 ssDNA binding protein [Erwinia phage vB_EamP-L1]